MTGRSPARFLAPLALVAVVIALFVVIGQSANDSNTGKSSGSRSQSSGQSSSSKGTKGKKRRKEPRRYTVKTGDTPSSIAEKTGVPLEQILSLNPNIDPQTLAPGQRIKLRQ
jgi:LysM repeat protein